MMTWKRIAFLLVLSGTLGGCATRTVLEADVVGQCLQTRVDTYWSNPNLSRDYSRNRMLVLEAVQPMYRAGPKAQFLDVIPAGTRLEIYQIERWDGYGQSYLRVIGRMIDGEYAGEAFDVSSCAPFHQHFPPRPMLVARCTMDPNQIRFNPEFLQACE